MPIGVATALPFKAWPHDVRAAPRAWPVPSVWASSTIPKSSRRLFSRSVPTLRQNRLPSHPTLRRLPSGRPQAPGGEAMTIECGCRPGDLCAGHRAARQRMVAKRMPGAAEIRAQIEPGGQTTPAPRDCADTRPGERPGTDQPDSGEPALIWPTCELCGGPIEPGHGYTRTSIDDAIWRRRLNRRLRKARRDGHIEGVAVPLVPWGFLHRECDGEIGDPAMYFISCAHAATARKLVIETAKLTRRFWYTDTDWRAMTAAILAADREARGGG